MPAIDERAFIAQVESADTDELIALLKRPSRDEERALRVHLGDAVYERLHQLAMQPTATRAAAKQGNVVITHGIMGGELTRTKDNGRPEALWIHVLRIMLGGVSKLRLSPEGRDITSVRATGILKRYYGPMLLSLAAEWNVHAFWYDWRKDLAASADKLQLEIEERFGKGQPVHIVAHSMGGLVARTFILRHPELWKGMWDEKGNGARGGRLIMLGTPNHGSFAIPQVMTGALAVVRKLAVLDVFNSLRELLGVLNTFPGSYQMLPSPLVMPQMEPLYQTSTYESGLGVLQRHLDTARRHHDALAPVIDVKRMIYLAGFNQPTHVDVRNRWQLGSLDSYSETLRGDGTVPHSLGFLEGVTNYFVETEHGNMPADQRVIDAVLQLLPSGRCSLAQTIPSSLRGAVDDALAARNAGRAARVQEELDIERVRLLAQRLRSKARGHEVGTDQALSGAERQAEMLMLEGFVGDGSARAPRAAADAYLSEETVIENVRPARREAALMKQQQQQPLQIEIAVAEGGIQDVDTLELGSCAVDAIAVGHYIGVKPQYAERELDRAISAAMVPDGEAVGEEDLLLTQLTERGIIRGDFGQPFFLEDPRRERRIIALAGMGLPGRFGQPELTVLAHELCWSLGRIGKRHLATVLIGAGAGNLTIPQAVHAWMRGIRRAITGSRADALRRLERITFIENDVRNIAPLHDAIAVELQALAADGSDAEVKFLFTPLNDELRADLHQRGFARARKELEEQWQRQVANLPKDGRTMNEDDPIAVRITVQQARKAFHFAAITASASIPQREIAVDPALIMEVNNEAAAADRSEGRGNRGRLLERLLIPADIRETIYTEAPIVLMLDSTTARIHWELIARDAVDLRASRQSDGAPPAAEERIFLGLNYGLTRQLRTTFAPPPEPPPPPRRTLRVLVVADPADDAPLAGAQAEGEQIAALFERFNAYYAPQSQNRIEVKKLIGPYQATRVNVMDELFNNRPYDVLHFAGHCVYDADDPANSGWIFSSGQRLTANELSRVDRVPKFIFSNACESGITPDRSDLRSVGLAPSFAEAFFARGVANLVCTAWPVNDQAALHFALRLYSGLLGLKRQNDFEPMHRAMQQARLEITEKAEGRSWAAYQHYGNPFFRFFDTSIFRQPKPANVAPPVPPVKKDGAKGGKENAPGLPKKNARKNKK